jgi:hypothetical protein
VKDGNGDIDERDVHRGIDRERERERSADICRAKDRGPTDKRWRKCSEWKCLVVGSLCTVSRKFLSTFPHLLFFTLSPFSVFVLP